ncbi:MAG TPA: response regulator transcription factor [Actinomycetota bacterium]|nr:response regulator transcription factor [Actinomycetota bacterium]
MSRRISVLVVDDHRMFAEAIEMLLAGQDGIEILGTATTGEEAVDLASRQAPDVVLMDIDLPGIDGIETTKRVRQVAPGAQVIIITAFQEPGTIAAAIQAGASGYVPKTKAADELLTVIRSAAAGEMVLPAGQLSAILARVQQNQQNLTEAERRLADLTSRELQVLQSMADGKSTPDMARELFISPLTVQTHIKNILSKLDVHSKLEAVTFAVRHGLVRISSRG